MRILILEDCDERQELMRACLGDRFPHYQIVFDRDSHSFCDRVRREGLVDVVVIALDHDLEMLPGEAGKMFDLGTGRLAAECLAELSPSCPVIIHSTNAPAAVGMQVCLEEAGWETLRVIPFVTPLGHEEDQFSPPADAEWINSVWFRTCRDAIISSVKSTG